MNRTDTADSPRALSITDFWNDAIEAAAQAAEEVARNVHQANGGILVSLGADKSAAAIRKLKR